MRKHRLVASFLSLLMTPCLHAEKHSMDDSNNNEVKRPLDADEEEMRHYLENLLFEKIKEDILKGDVDIKISSHAAKDEDEDEDQSSSEEDLNSDETDASGSLSSSDEDENEDEKPLPLPSRKRRGGESFDIIIAPAKVAKTEPVGDNHQGLSLSKDWMGEVPTMIQQLLAYYRDEARFIELGAEMPKAFLFAGPPGVGKTYLAKILSSELAYPLTYITGPSLKSKYVGGSKDNVKKIFSEARARASQHKRAMIFIDEIDAVGSRDEESGNKMAARELINQLLAEVDGFHAAKILLFAATNHIASIDGALLRSGRFETVNFELPSPETRTELFEFYAKRLKVEDFEAAKAHFAKNMLQKTKGLSSADFKAFCNQAALFAGFEKANFVEIRHFDQAFEALLKKRKDHNEVPEAFKHLFS